MRSSKRHMRAFLCALALGTALPVAFAQDADSNAATDREKVFVTGSNIPTIDRETAVPVQIITREEIQRANIQTAADLAQTISANVSYGNFTENQATAFASSPGLAAASLRGLTAQRTLILVNGRRIANYALAGTVTDLNVIPLAAIERVEVLKDGASAIYGSDAIGGVINFIMLDDFRGLNATAQYSSPEHTGGWSDQFNVTAGYGSLAEQKFNVYGMIDYQKFGALSARDREFSKSYYIPGAFNQTSSTSFPANVVVGNNDFRNPTGNPANGYQNPSCAPPVSFPTTAAPNSQPNRCNFDPGNFLNSINGSERLATSGALTWQFATDHQFFAQGFFARNSFTVVGSPTSFAPTLLTRFLLPATSPWYPHAFAAAFGLDGKPLDVRWRSVELGGRTSEPVLDQWNVVAGLKGTLAGWRYDSAFTYGVNSVDDRYTSGYVLGPAIAPLLESGLVNPFGYNTPDVVAELKATQVNGTVRTGKSSLAMLDVRAWNSIYELPAGPLSVALGAEARQWRQTETSSPELAAGLIVQGSMVGSMSASRDAWAVFGEANAPLFRDFEAIVALRFDHYSDVSATTNPKVSLRWQPDRTLLFRASAGTGGRAPSLEALYAPRGNGTTTGVVVDLARCPSTNGTRDCNGPFRTQFGGRPLASETSSQWGVGTVWTPIPSLSLGVDYFDVIVHDLIQPVGADTVLALCPDGVSGPTCGLVRRGPSEPAYPTLPGPIEIISTGLVNFGTVRTTGVDLSARYRFPMLPWGQLTFSGQGTYIIKYLQQQVSGNVNMVNHEINTGPFGAIPYWHHYLTLDWNYGPWSATLTQNFLKGTYDAFAAPGQSQLRKVGNYDVWNLSASYSGFAGWRLSAGIKNLFDRDPPFTNQTFTASAGAPAGYDPTYANPIGRVFWAALAYRFN